MQMNSETGTGLTRLRTTLPVALAAAAIAFGAYLATLAPTVTGEDAGELISASYCDGVPHPPGYPLWVILTKPWVRALGWGEIAWRTNAFSAVCAALSVLVVVYAAVEMGLSRVGAFAAGLLFGLSRTFWSQANISEVYALAILTVVVCLFFVLRYENSGKKAYAYAAALALGFAVTGHYLVVLLAPSMALLIVTRKRWVFLGPTRIAAALALAAVPLSVFLVLMYRAKAAPPLNWGDPHSLPRLWAHFLRSQYPSELTKNVRNVPLLLRQFGVLADTAVQEFSPLGLAFIPAGIAAMWRAARLRKFVFLSSVAFMGGAGVVLIMSFPLEREIVQSVQVFFMYAWLACAMLIAASVEFLGDFLKDYLPVRLRGAAVPVAVTMLLAGAAAWTNYREINMRGNYLAYDYAANMLRSAAPGAIIFPGGDHNTFPLLYLVIVEKRRPDVTVADKYGYIERSVYKDMPGNFPEIPNKQQRSEILAWIVGRETRPIYFSEPPNLPGVKLKQEGLLFRVVADGEDLAPNGEVWQSYQWRNIKDDELTAATTDYASQMIMSDYCTMRAQYFLESGRTLDGERMLAKAALYGEGVKEVLNNLGSLAAENRLMALARQFYHRAIDIDPTYATPWRNLEVIEKQSERLRAQSGQGPEEMADLRPPDPMSLVAPFIPRPPGSPQPGLPDFDAGYEGFAE